MKETPTFQKLKQRITGKKNKTDLVKTANTEKDFPPAAYSYRIMLSTSPVTRAWKHQIPCVTCHCYVWGFGCSLHSLLSKEGSPFSHMTTGTDGDQHWGALSASLQVAHQYCRWTWLEHVLKWEFPAWRKWLSPSSAWLHLVAKLHLQMEVVPRNTSWENPKAFLVTWESIITYAL